MTLPYSLWLNKTHIEFKLNDEAVRNVYIIFNKTYIEFK